MNANDKQQSGAAGWPHMSASRAAKLRQRLLEERDHLVTRLTRHMGEATADPPRASDDLDLALQSHDQERLLRLADKERKLLNAIEHALSKFADASYGLCEGTGEPIEQKRLNVRPWARYSTEYKEELERARKGHPARLTVDEP